MIAICRSSTLRITCAGLTWSVKIAAAPVCRPAGARAKSASSSCTRTTKGAAWIASAKPRARGLHLPGGDRLQDALDLAGMDRARRELEGELDRLAGYDIARIDLGDLDADDRVGCR